MSDLRVRALRDLIEIRRPISEILEELGSMPPDDAAGVVELSVLDAVRVLEAYKVGTFDDSVIEAWAEVVHGRDDISLEEDHSDLLSQLLFELSTPELFEPVSSAVFVWVKRLQML